QSSPPEQQARHQPAPAKKPLPELLDAVPNWDCDFDSAEEEQEADQNLDLLQQDDIDELRRGTASMGSGGDRLLFVPPGEGETVPTIHCQRHDYYYRHADLDELPLYAF